MSLIKNDVVDAIAVCLSITVFGYIFINLATVLAGIEASEWDPHRITNQKCNSPLVRIEYVFPGYRVGCWLGQPMDNKK